MRISEDYDVAGVPSGEIPAGELFVYAGSYYMRGQVPPDLLVEPKNGSRKEQIVAINLATGELALVLETEKVPPIHARIRISGRAD